MFRIGANRHAALPLGVTGDPIAHLPGQIQAGAIGLEYVDDAEALLVMIEAAGNEIVEDALACVSERRMSEVVPERDRLRQFLVEAQHLGDAAGDLRNFERVSQARAVVIAGWSKEDLRLVLQASKRLAVDDAIAVALERWPDRILRLRTEPSAGVGTLRRLRRENLPLAFLELFADVRHSVTYVFAARTLTGDHEFRS